MPRVTILFVDNDADFLDTRAEFLLREGYLVLAATDILTAQEYLKKDNIDLAILDLRLNNDDDEKDFSGLILAKDESIQDIPKIVLTNHPSMDGIRTALRPGRDGKPLAVNFLTKEEGPLAMLQAVDRALQKQTTPSSNRDTDDKLTAVTLNVPSQLLKDYEAARQHAAWIHWVWLGLIIGGAIVFLSGVVAAILGYVNFGVLGAAGGAIAETLGLLLTKFARDANRRWEQFHKELVLFYKKQQGAIEIKGK